MQLHQNKLIVFTKSFDISASFLKIKYTGIIFEKDSQVLSGVVSVEMWQNRVKFHCPDGKRYTIFDPLFP